MLSLLIHHRAPSTLVFIQYIFAMAVCHAVKSVCAKQDFPVFIKWPNDIYTRKDGKLQKIGGILVTSSYDGGIFKVVVGCGLNVENSKPTVSLRQIAQAFGVDPGCMTRESLLASILTHFELLYRIFEAEESFSSLLDGYLANWLHRYASEVP